jgi:hypothetical protein
MQNFWAEKIVHVVSLPTTAMKHMQHLENGGELFLTLSGPCFLILAWSSNLQLSHGRSIHSPFLEIIQILAILVYRLKLGLSNDIKLGTRNQAVFQ